MYPRRSTIGPKPPNVVTPKQKGTPLGTVSDSPRGYFLPPSLGGQRSKHPVLPGTGREQRGGLALDASRPWYGAVACEALSAAAFSSLAEEASSQAYLSGIRPGARPRFHTRLTPVFYA